MDDCGGGGDQKDVVRMRGMRDRNGKYDGTIPRVLDTCGFKAKHIVVGGDCSKEEAESMGGKFLGIGYNPETDYLQLKLSTTVKVKA